MSMQFYFYSVLKEKQLSKKDCKISIAEIRASVITNWLQHYNLREVQYMAGHKFVSSTERYRTDNLEDLQKELEKYHPLK
jgi:integrase/recombinase XerD